MGQILKTAHFGEVEFTKTWVTSTGKHIGKLAKGGYAFLSGQPITKKKDLTDCIPGGTELEEALNWFSNKDKIKEETVPPKMVVIQRDGSYAFDDGSPIKDVADLIEAIPRGPVLDAAVAWFTNRLKGQELHAKSVEVKRENAIERNIEEAHRKVGRPRLSG